MSHKKSKTTKTSNGEINMTLSAEFLDSMIETSMLTAIKHMREHGGNEDVIILLIATHCMVTEYGRVLTGRASPDDDSVMPYVADASRQIVFLGGTFYTETGRVTPINKRP